MKMSNCEIRPGRVIKVEDQWGTVKASCVGVFSDEDDPDLLPPVYPFLQASASSFNQPKVNDPIWVFLFSDNPQELFYVFQGSVSTETADILSGSPDDAQILACKNSGMSKASLYFSTDDGWMMKNDDASIQIDSDCSIRVGKSLDSRAVKIDDECISIGDGAGSQPAVLGDSLQSCLYKLYAGLKKTAVKMKSNPYTMDAGAQMEASIEAFRKDIRKITSDEVRLI